MPSYLFSWRISFLHFQLFEGRLSADIDYFHFSTGYAFFASSFSFISSQAFNIVRHISPYFTLRLSRQNASASCRRTAFIFADIAEVFFEIFDISLSLAAFLQPWGREIRFFIFIFRLHAEAFELSRLSRWLPMPHFTIFAFQFSSLLILI